MSKTVTLHCQAGNHSWERPAQRGRKPLNCPEHQPEPVVTKTTNGMVELHCEAGDHTWQRPSQRGKRPASCPECVAKAEPVASEPTVVRQADAEVVTRLMATKLVERSVATAFALAGVEPPHRDVIDRVGFSAAQRKILKGGSDDDFNADDFEPTLVAA